MKVAVLVRDVVMIRWNLALVRYPAGLSPLFHVRKLGEALIFSDEDALHEQ